jgi:hypothetical protein
MVYIIRESESAILYVFCGSEIDGILSIIIVLAVKELLVSFWGEAWGEYHNFAPPLVICG